MKSWVWFASHLNTYGKQNCTHKGDVFALSPPSVQEKNAVETLARAMLVRLMHPSHRAAGILLMRAGSGDDSPSQGAHALRRGCVTLSMHSKPSCGGNICQPRQQKSTPENLSRLPLHLQGVLGCCNLLVLYRDLH